jgi:drug/metabolite transporter (DMT)-like permease
MLGLSPLVTTGLAVGSGQERGDARLWAGLAVGVAGVGISLAPELGSARVGVGVAVTLVGMLGLASATVLQRRWGAVADPRVSVAAQSVAAALLVDPAALVFGGHVEASARLVLCMAWLAWGMGIVSLLGMVSILRRHAASVLAALLLAVPAVTAIGSAVALGEALHPASLGGMLVAMAMAGIGAVLRREAEPAAAAAAARGASLARC